ncbi:MAG: sialidase family protein [Pirellulales bacterium]
MSSCQLLTRRKGCYRGTVIIGLWALLAMAPAAAQETPEQRFVIAIERIWDRPGHAAFTDLARQGEYLYCTFREGSGHIPGLNGTIRVIRSRDGAHWESAALLDEPHVDLRDPKLSITPDGRLMINMGASYYHGSQRVKIESRVAFSDTSGATFGPAQRVEFPAQMITGGDWLWRVTWHARKAWACVQQVFEGGRTLRLVQSDDGIRYREVAQLDVDAPSETTLRFLDDGTLLAMIRCESKPPIGRIGTARPPYTEWKFVDSNKRFGGPNMIQLPSGAWLAGSRDYLPQSHTALWWLDLPSGHFRDVLKLPSSGDNSYPGFVVDRECDRLYMSYYSSHEGRTAIYLATLRLSALEAAAGAKQ